MWPVGVASAGPWVCVCSSLFAFGVLGLLTPVARADTIVFRVGTDIMRMNGDGGDQRALTHGEQRFEWPSTADDGTLVASDEARSAAPDLVCPARRSTRRSRPPRPSPPRTCRPRRRRTSGSTPDGTEDRLHPAHRRRSDHALDPRLCAAHLNFPGQALGQRGLTAPSWVGNDQLVLSRDVTSDAPAAVALYPAVAGDNSEEAWFSDDAADWASGFGAVSLARRDAAGRAGRRRRRQRRRCRPGSPCACSRSPGRARPRRSAASWGSRPRTPTRSATRRSPRTAAGSPGPRATASTPPRSAPWGTARDPRADPHPPGRVGAALELGPGASGSAGAPVAREAHARGEHPAAAAARDVAPARAGGAGDDQRARDGPFLGAGRGWRQEAALRGRAHAGPLSNAGTTTIRVRLRPGALRSAKRLVLRASAPGATPVEVVLRPQRLAVARVATKRGRAGAHHGRVGAGADDGPPCSWTVQERRRGPVGERAAGVAPRRDR